MSASSPPLIVVRVASTFPSRSTVAPAPSVIGSTLIVMVVSAITSPVSASRKLSPEFSTTSAPVDSTVTPALIVRSSPGPAASVEVSVTVPAAVTLLATVSGLAAEAITCPAPASTPIRPSTVPISRAPVLLRTMLPSGEEAATLPTAKSMSEAPAAPIPKAARNATSPAVTKAASLTLLSKMVPFVVTVTVPPALCRSTSRKSPLPETSRSPPRALTRLAFDCSKEPPPTLSLSAVSVTTAADVVSTNENENRLRSLFASRSIVPPFVRTVSLAKMLDDEFTTIVDAAPVASICSLRFSPPISKSMFPPAVIPASPSTVPTVVREGSCRKILPLVAFAAIKLISRSMSAGPAAPMPVAARSATVLASIKAVSAAVLSVILPAEVVTCTSPPVVILARLILLTASMSIRPVPRLVMIDPSAKSTVPAESMSIKNAAAFETCAGLFNTKSPPKFCSFKVPIEAATLFEIVMVSFDLKSTALPVTASLTVRVPVVVRKIELAAAVIPAKPSTVPISNAPVLSIENPPLVTLVARVLTFVSIPVIPPGPPTRKAARSAVIRAFPVKSLMPPPLAVTRTSLVVETCNDSILKKAVKSISLAPASIEPTALNSMSLAVASISTLPVVVNAPLTLTRPAVKSNTPAPMSTVVVVMISSVPAFTVRFAVNVESTALILT
ncbi:hypothetical protein Enr17x_15050 [Gimesia fumaroli]|uniref:Uncharacterized protein n=1 Tax=Gimesia fumaroli TaxID=2527976 RepID=A0A518I8S4_9PLAN|nr:hypothetical protein Enr17x_15050 [Gimesia fumaroli]